MARVTSIHRAADSSQKKVLIMKTISQKPRQSEANYKKINKCTNNSAVHNYTKCVCQRSIWCSSSWNERKCTESERDSNRSPSATETKEYHQWRMGPCTLTSPMIREDVQITVGCQDTVSVFLLLAQTVNTVEEWK